MKFGSEFTDRSILKWRNYNLDYNDLKLKIKGATQIGNTDESGDISDPTEDRNQVRAMKQLYTAFKDQIEFVSLFVASKHGEFQTRLQLLQRRFSSGNYSRELQKDLVELSHDFQKISRFIMLQKLALRKLFKKFLKHSRYRYKEDFVERIKLNFLDGNPDSFVNLSLDDSIQSLGRMLDSMNEPTQSTPRSASAAVPSSTPRSVADQFARFDLESIQKASNVELYWVHQDNLAELKLNLFSNFKSNFITSKNQTDLWLTNLDEVEVKDFSAIPCTITSYSSDDKPLVLTPTGGLRQVSFTRLNTHSVSFLQQIGETDDWHSYMVANSRMSQMSIDFIRSRGLVPCFKTSSDKLRFRSNDDKTFITLRENIRTTNQGLLELSFDESEHSSKFPFGIMEIRYESKYSEIPEFIAQLCHSHLCYRVDTLNFSMFNYLTIKYYPDKVSDDVFVTKFDWFKDFSKDIRTLPQADRPKQALSIRSNRSAVSGNPSNGILLNKSSSSYQLSRASKPASSTTTYRYWNEFDDDPEFENSEFLVYCDDQESTGISSFKWLLSPEKVDSIWSVSRFFRKLFKFPNRSQEEAPLISKGTVKYMATTSNNSDSDSTTTEVDEDSHLFRQLNNYSPLPKSRTLVQEAKHDQVVTFLYMLCLSLSCLTFGVAIGMFATMVSSVGKLKDIWDGANSNATIMLVIIVLITFAIALVLCTFSVCLLFNRHSQPPVWHQALVWSTFTIISCIFVIGVCMCIQ
ncbi:unnamed protein product [Kuraishia capsulata CBS 1993]|uniref:SPX domain-containing protein n=1 Tax=Kuraishia capsulata CBS 1993 TaxID=1382522 RepID=W6MFN6_9ASCO|nr:uncharacterized protein KUCA_T00000138001 [Kuraishia capsulata CBS 1993]CDK24178.1 unnamed protein product [Kuraishia capsulata CBS 1993]